jgi:tRNA A37 threonylcarbamoyladenosine biosynthesis protein TsaE
VDLGVEELVHGDGVPVAEWVDKLLPPHAITVTITGLGDEPRQISLARSPSKVPSVSSAARHRFPGAEGLLAGAVGA